MNNNIIVFAQKEEFVSFYNKLEKKYLVEHKINNIKYFTYTKNNIGLIFFISGVGKVNAGYELTKLITLHTNIKQICNVGVAGSINNEISINDIIVATKVSYYDVDLTTFNRLPGQLPDLPQYFECNIKNINKIKKLNINNIKYGLILSGDTFITRDNLKNDIIKNFDNPLACDMESAAIGQISYLERIPFTIIRSISDDAQINNNKEVYNNNLKRSSDIASEVLIKILNIK